MCDMPLVSVAMITYNHENYIGQSIQSILKQNIEFPIEVVVGDDCSQDATQIYLKKMEKDFSNITAICREQNIGVTANLSDILYKCRGRYIAILEGDDFWVYKNKLKEQVDFLEKNIDYSACYHRVSTVDENSKMIAECPIGIGCDGSEFTWSDFSKLKLPGQTGTVLFRNILTEEDYNVLKFVDDFIGDRTLSMLLLNKGKIKVMDGCWSAYRVVIKENGANYSSVVRNKNESANLYRLYSRLGECQYKKYDKNIQPIEMAKARIHLSAILIAMRKPIKTNIENLKGIDSLKKRGYFVYILKVILDHFRHSNR